MKKKECENSWYVARVEDERGNWALTSPIYFSTIGYQKPKEASVIAFEIGNFTRYCELRQQFCAHIIITTAPGRLIKVSLLRDGKLFKEFLPEDGNYMPSSGKLPGRRPGGEYNNGWVWHPSPASAFHFQADYIIGGSGWYSVKFETIDGKETTSQQIYFDADNPNSQQISLLCLYSDRTKLALRGYGEEMKLTQR